MPGVFKAVIPAAGRGVRMRPISLTVPKEMITLGRKTMIQMAGEDSNSRPRDFFHTARFPSLLYKRLRAKRSKAVGLSCAVLVGQFFRRGSSIISGVGLLIRQAARSISIERFWSFPSEYLIGVVCSKGELVI